MNLGMTRNGFFAFAIGPDVMLPSVTQEVPAQLAEGSLQVASLDGLDCTRIGVHSQEPLCLSHRTPGLRRRMPLMRTRAELLAHIQPTNSQDNLPEMGKTLAYKGNRDGVAERFLDPAVQKSVEVDLALIDHDDRLLSDQDIGLLP